MTRRVSNHREHRNTYGGTLRGSKAPMTKSLLAILSLLLLSACAHQPREPYADIVIQHARA